MDGILLPSRRIWTQAEGIRLGLALDPALKRSPHSLIDVGALVERSLRAARQHWAWRPDALLVGAHRSARVMGRAYPTLRTDDGAHVLTLSTTLLRDYDAPSIGRTLIHELCHLAREALHPRSLAGRSAEQMHDGLFCRMLAVVDPIVAQDPHACRFFRDELGDAGKERVAKKEAARAKAAAKIVWTPEAGQLIVDRLKTGKITLAWESTGLPTWRAPKAKLNDAALVGLLARFPAAAWSRVPVAVADPWLDASLGRPRHLAAFATAATTRWSWLLPKSKAMIGS